MELNRRESFKELIGLGLAGAALLSGQESSRPFRMGFTPLTSDPALEGWTKAFETIGRYGDLAALFIQDGLPWDEAVAGLSIKEFPSGIRGFLEFQLSMISQFNPNHARYLAINPSSVDYRQLAASWEVSTNEPLGYPWNTYDFDHPDVKLAVLNYLLALVEYFSPTYLNIGIEANLVLARNFEHWPAFLELHRFLYTELKKRYPKLPVFASVQYEHLLGLHGDSARLRDRFLATEPDILLNEVRKLLQYSDILAISSYPYMIEHLRVDGDYFQVAAILANERKIPIAIDQTGYTSQPLLIQGIYLPGSEAAQEQYTNFVLQLAQGFRMPFVVNFVSTDYGTAFGEDPVSLAWAYTGLFRTDGTPKPALSVWEKARAVRFQS